MIPLIVIFHAKDDPPIWPDLADKAGMILDAGTLSKVAILGQGMESGLPSVMFRIDLPDGRIIITQQTARQVVSLGRMIAVKYPDLMDDQ